MEILYFWEIIGLEFHSPSISITNYDITLISDGKVLLGGPQNLKPMIEPFGMIDLAFLVQETPVAFKKMSLPNDTSKQDLIKFGFLLSGSLTQYLGNLWYIRDSCAQPRAGFLYTDNPDLCSKFDHFSHLFMSNCEIQNVAFSPGEFVATDDLTLKYTELVKKLGRAAKPINVPKSWEYQKFSRLNAMEYNSFLKIQRADTLLATARENSHVLTKIALYTSFLESLFTTSDTEISHKVSERCAYFLGSDRESRLKVFDQVKRCYNIRSNYLHGAKLKKYKKEDIVEACREIDEIARRIMTKIINEESELVSEELDPNSYFKSFLFT